MAKKYRGKYIGIVITAASEDPEGRNRVQVWVPHVMNTLYKDWNATEDDKIIFNLNSNQSSISSPEIERLRNSLPWAECASFLIGGGAPFVTNRQTNKTSISTERVLDENYDFSDVPIDPFEGVPIDPSLDIAPEDDIPLPDVLPLPEDQTPTTPIPPDEIINGNVEPPLPVE